MILLLFLVGVVNGLGPGCLDTTFNGKGYAVIGDSATGTSITMNPLTGDILMGGSALLKSGVNGFGLGLFSQRGKPGFFTVTPIGAPDRESGINALTFLNGKIVAAGPYYAGTKKNIFNYDFAIARYHPNGKLDKSFNKKGTQTTDFYGNDDEASGIAGQEDGKVIVVGRATLKNGDQVFAAVRYTTDGQLDFSYNKTGKITIQFPASVQSDRAIAISLQKDGKSVIVGYANLGFLGAAFGVVRITKDGLVDPTFTPQTTTFGTGDARAYGVAIQQDGKVVVAGSTTGDLYSIVSGFAIARYLPTGQLDQEFGVGGKTFTFSSGLMEAHGVVIQEDQSLMVAGFALYTDHVAVVLQEYKEDGSEGHMVSDTIKTLNPIVYGMTMDQKGNVIVAAASHDPNQFMALRYNMVCSTKKPT